MRVETLSGMIRRAYEICSNEDELKKELAHLKSVFTTTNGYPYHLVSSVMKKTREQQQQKLKLTSEEGEEPVTEDSQVEEKILMLKVPYAGPKGETLLKDLNNNLQNETWQSRDCPKP